MYFIFRSIPTSLYACKFLINVIELQFPPEGYLEKIKRE